MRVLYVFIDGVGYGEAGEKNPVCPEVCPTLCALMQAVCDSNILRRAGDEALKDVRAMAKNALKNGAVKESLREMNDVFVRRNISPGGSADLLALTYFLYDWETREK